MFLPTLSLTISLAAAAAVVRPSAFNGPTHPNRRFNLRPSPPLGMVSMHEERILSNSCSGGLSHVLVDVENVRGKSSFEMTHGEVLDRIAVWARRKDMIGHVTMVVDHGSEQAAYWLGGRGVGIVFAGESLNADDVIARDVEFCIAGGDSGEGGGREVVVVTSDEELRCRCRSAAMRASVGGLRMISSARFLQDLEELGGELVAAIDRGLKEEGEEVRVGESSSPRDFVVSDLLEKDAGIADIKSGLKLARERMQTEKSPKSRRKYLRQIRELREKLAAHRISITDMAAGGSSEGMAHRGGCLLPEVEFSNLSPTAQDFILVQWANLRRERNDRRQQELTSDRVVLAEALREGVERLTVEEWHRTESENLGVGIYPAEVHIQHMNRFCTEGP